MLLIHFAVKLLLFLEPALFLIYDLLNVPSPAAPLPPLMNPNVVFVITASPYELRARPLKTAAAGLTRSVVMDTKGLTKTAIRQKGEAAREEEKESKLA